LGIPRPFYLYFLLQNELNTASTKGTPVFNWIESELIITYGKAILGFLIEQKGSC